MFWNKDLNKLIAKQTNLYSVQKDGKIIATTEDEIKQFIGIQMLNSHVDLSSYRYIGLGKLGTPPRPTLPPIADVMPITRYTKLRQYLHFSDNSNTDDAENKKKQLYKIQPAIDHVRRNYRTINSEIELIVR